MTYPIDRRRKLADLLLENAGLVKMLPRFGIGLGFGEKSVAEVCQNYGVDCNLFLLISSIYALDDYEPTLEEIQATDVIQLVNYLRNSHEHYLNDRLPHIEAHLGRIEAQMAPTAAKAFVRFFETYKADIADHFEYEESKVHPHIERLSQGRETDFSISCFALKHSHELEDKLDDITQIIFKFLPTSVTDQEAIDVVHDILTLSYDMRKHTKIEDKVLVPYGKHLEKIKK